MEFLGEVIGDVVDFFATAGSELWEVIGLTFAVSGTATVIGATIGIPLGVALGIGTFRGRSFTQAVVNTGMAIPPVLAGLVVLLLVWRDGPGGALDLVFTPAAMITAQTLLAVPIAAAVTAAAIRSLSPDAHEQLVALRLPATVRGRLVVKEAWPGVAAAVAAAFGRVLAEVGAVLVVGGNIRGETRVLTTAIVQEARQARFGAALALGI
ncbi:MAG: ABC transporter permease, partial [Acidimicrobiia bacterium]|nr:ABC transporter permease [Acidimicrobiia bacterium]